MSFTGSTRGDNQNSLFANKAVVGGTLRNSRKTAIGSAQSNLRNWPFCDVQHLED